MSTLTPRLSLGGVWVVLQMRLQMMRTKLAQVVNWLKVWAVTLLALTLAVPRWLGCALIAPGKLLVPVARAYRNSPHRSRLVLVVHALAFLVCIPASYVGATLCAPSVLLDVWLVRGAARRRLRKPTVLNTVNN